MYSNMKKPSWHSQTCRESGEPLILCRVNGLLSLWQLSLFVLGGIGNVVTTQSIELILIRCSIYCTTVYDIQLSIIQCSTMGINSIIKCIPRQWWGSDIYSTTEHEQLHSNDVLLAGPSWPLRTARIRMGFCSRLARLFMLLRSSLVFSDVDQRTPLSIWCNFFALSCLTARQVVASIATSAKIDWWSVAWVAIGDRRGVLSTANWGSVTLALLRPYIICHTRRSSVHKCKPLDSI